MCFGKAEENSNEKESNWGRIAAGLLQMYMDKTASTTKPGAFVAYLVHAALLNFEVQFRQKLIRIGNTLVEFDPFE